MNVRTTLPSRARVRGLSMIEVLVAIVIISLGLLGMAGLQASSLRGSQSAVYRAQAVQFAADMAERMRANLGASRSYTFALGGAAPSGTSVMDLDRADWLARLATLPGGLGSIAIDAVNNAIKFFLDKAEEVAAAAKKIGGAIGGLLGHLPGLQGGGPVEAGKAYIVGESGPELFIAGQSGTIIPHYSPAPGASVAAVGGGGVTLNFYGPTVGTSREFEDTVRRALYDVGRRNVSSGV